MPEHAQLHRRFYEIAEAIAPGWERRRDRIEETAAPAREWMLSALSPRPGDTVLELAAGVGDTGFAAARMVGPQGHLICSDFSPSMLDAARRRGDVLGVENVDYRVIDAERIELEDDSVDGVLCRYGFMLMSDPAAALGETRRVLRPGGRLALAVFSTPERNPFFALVAMSLVRRGHIPPPDPDGPGIFALADEARTVALLEEAGFEDVRTETLPMRFPIADADDHLGFIGETAGPIAVALRGLTEQEHADIRADLEAALTPFATDGGYELPGLTLAAVAS